jgi:hypothetical protein
LERHDAIDSRHAVIMMASMRNPFMVARLAAFTIALLLLLQEVEPGWGVDGAWGWYLAIFLLTFSTVFDLVSFVACVLAFLLLVGLVDAGRASYIALTIFTGVALIRPRGLGMSAFDWRGWRSQGDWGWSPGEQLWRRSGRMRRR